MAKITSFVGEHTVEHILAPKLKTVLAKEYEFITPMYPWMTREGSNISKKIHESDSFKIIGLYPRRPKLLISDLSKIHFKINEQIIIGAKEGLSKGVPIIGGLPLARNFWELGSDPYCLWFKLHFNENIIQEFDITLNGESSSKTLNGNIFDTNEKLLSFIRKNSKPLDLPLALDVFKSIKMKSMNLNFYSSFAFMGGYKPIYFLLR